MTRRITLREEYPEVAEMWAYDLNGDLTPDNVTSGSDKEAYFRCTKNPKHVFKRRIQKMISHRTHKSIGCMYCGENAKVPFPGENDLLTVVPKAKEMWDYEKNTLDPTQLFPKSSKRAYFKCEHGHSVKRKISDFTGSPQCPECSHIDSLFVTHIPEVTAFWDYNKNTDILENVIRSEQKMEWFKCPDCNYEWNAGLPLFRERPYCPSCGYDTVTHRELDKPVRTLRMEVPDIDDIWDYEANGDYTPDNLTYRSNLLAHFKCKKYGHTFDSKIDSMYNSKRQFQGCLVCNEASIRTIIGVNDAYTLIPRLKDFWDSELNPNIDLKKLKAASLKSIKLRCTDNPEHIFQSTVLDFSKNPVCRICDMRERSLAATKPDAMKFWDYDKNMLNPYEIYPYSKISAFWKCPDCGYEWEQEVSARVITKNVCVCCGLKRKKILPRHSFAVKNPEAAKLWVDELNNGITPENTAAHSDRRVYLRCKHNPKHVYSTLVSNIPSKDPYGCPYCSHRAVIKGEDLFSLYPKTREMWDYENNQGYVLDEINPYSTDIVQWKCANGHTFSRSIRRFAQNSNCPVCRNTKNAIIHYPHILKHWDFERNQNIDIHTTSANSETMAFWKCPDCGYEWEAQISSRKFSKGYCPCCETRIVVKEGITDLFTFVPDLEQYYDYKKNEGINVASLSTASTQKVWWTCEKCGLSRYLVPPEMILHLGKSAYQAKECPGCKGYVRVIPIPEEFPELVDMFVKDKNSISVFDLKPANYSQKFWWHCQQCGEYFFSQLATVIHGLDGYAKGCPYCAGLKVTKERSFAYLHPDLMEEYSPNNTIDAFNVSEFSTKQAEWVCKNNPSHIWISSFFQRSRGYGKCRKCHIFNYECMFWEEYPEMEPYYDTEKNERAFISYPVSSQEKVFWKCEHGHSFLRSFLSINRSGLFSCPICENTIVEEGINDLQTLYPELALEYDCEKNHNTPNQVTIRNSDWGTWWKCKYGHSFQTSVGYRVDRNQSCPICKGTLIISGINDALTRYPALKDIWNYTKNPLPPEKCSACLTNSFWFTCEHGHSYQAILSSVVNNDFKCQICHGIRLQTGINSLIDTHPELCKEISINETRTPDTLLKHYAFSILWTCPTCNGEYLYPINERELNDNSCPYCNKNRPLLGYNTLIDTHPELCNEWSNNNTTTPVNYMKHYASSVLWICPTCNGEYSYPIRERELNDESCPYCNKNRPLLGFNTLIDTHPKLCNEWSPDNDCKPNSFTKASSFRALWICPTCNGEYTYPIRERELNDDSCPYCSHKKPLSGYNTIDITNPDLLDEWDFINNYLFCHPDNMLASSCKKVWWKCKVCGYNYQLSPKEKLMFQKRHQKSCPMCKGLRRRRFYFFRFRNTIK